MPRLVNRSRVAATPSASSVAEMPSYQPPACPLNDGARRALGDLSSNRGTAPYEMQLKDSTRHLGLAVGDLQERLYARRQRLEGLQDKRSETGADKTAEEVRLEHHMQDFEPQVDALTRESEAAVRSLIDMKAELDDEAALLGDLYTTAATTHNTNVAAAAQRLAREAEDGNEAEEEKETVVPSTVDSFRELRGEKHEQYAALGHHQRYGRNNDYVGFKKIWHDAAAGEDGPPLADASKWFRPNGEPVLDRPGASNRRSTMGAADEEEDDDDIAVAREVLSLNCPLTLRPMEEPYSNVKCKHTFEKSAVLGYLQQGGGQVQCPQTGCSETFSKARFNNDFYLDQAMLRKIQRAKQTQRNNELNEDEMEEDPVDGDESVLMQTQRPAGCRAPKQERA
ncbi:hypothetical protein RJ55_08510 [Drechmeria coniospora]|nr:hypothetical protein RJ55_08510 [Drechmeria coniospora]